MSENQKLNENVSDLPFNEKANLISQMFGEGKEISRVISALRHVSVVPSLIPKIREHDKYQELITLYSEFEQEIRVDVTLPITMTIIFGLPDVNYEFCPTLDDPDSGMWWEEHLLHIAQEEAKDKVAVIEEKFNRMDQICEELAEDLDADIYNIHSALERINYENKNLSS